MQESSFTENKKSISNESKLVNSRYYEYVLLLKHNITRDIAKNIISEILKFDINNSAEKYSEFWGLRKLAYQMRKNKSKSAYYYMISLEALVSDLPKIENYIKYESDIMRSEKIMLEERRKEKTFILKNLENDIKEGITSFDKDFDFFNNSRIN